MSPKPVADMTPGQKVSFAIRARDLGCAVGFQADNLRRAKPRRVEFLPDRPNYSPCGPP